MEKARKNWLVIGLVVLALAGGYYAWQNLDRNALPAGIASGNGRIEAVEIDISTKTPGRIKEIMVDEGDFVTAGQVLAQMDTVQLEAHKRQAEAQERRAVIGVEAAKNLVTQREAEKAAADAVLAQRRAQLDAAERRLVRSEQLVKTSTVSQQVLDDDRATAEGKSCRQCRGSLARRVECGDQFGEIPGRRCRSLGRGSQGIGRKHRRGHQRQHSGLAA